MMRSLRRSLGACATLTCVVAALHFPTADTPAEAASADGFVATFDTPEDFYERFDYGYSGIDSRGWPDLTATRYQGDHDEQCGGADTQRTVDVSDAAGGFANVFWWCRGHVMTGVNSFNYNIAWFSPKPTFENISRVCWDVNMTDMSSRKWTQVMFVGMEDARHYPMPESRGTGGWDLGFTNPDFRTASAGVSTGIDSWHGDLTGIMNLTRTYFRFFDDAAGGWADDGFNSSSNQHFTWTDKATRYQTCMSNAGATRILVEQDTPFGARSHTINGQIPQDEVRVVFQDDNYNGPKGDRADPAVNTWHWDNIIIETGDRASPSIPSASVGVPAAMMPARVVDTRSGSGNVTIDGQYQHGGKVTPGNPLEVQIAGRANIPSNATAAFLNFTVSEPDGPGYLTVYPCDDPPNASTVNYTQPGQTVANLALSDLSDDGTVCIFALTTTHVIVDATGYAPAGVPAASGSMSAVGPR